MNCNCNTNNFISCTRYTYKKIFVINLLIIAIVDTGRSPVECPECRRMGYYDLQGVLTKELLDSVSEYVPMNSRHINLIY